MNSQAPQQDFQAYPPMVKQMYDHLYSVEYLMYLHEINEWEKYRKIIDKSLKQLKLNNKILMKKRDSLSQKRIEESNKGSCFKNKKSSLRGYLSLND
ncbi:hypothetical protein pb186bvf_000673 [Paramecium bursaria]